MCFPASAGGIVGGGGGGAEASSIGVWYGSYYAVLRKLYALLMIWKCAVASSLVMPSELSYLSGW